MHPLNIEVIVVDLGYLSFGPNARHLFITRNILHLDQHLQETVVTGQNGSLILSVNCSLVLILNNIHKSINLNEEKTKFHVILYPFSYFLHI